MRKLIVLSFITLDGVMQAPGGPEEDPTGGFKYGGWVAGYFDDFLGKVMNKQMSRPFDLLLDPAVAPDGSLWYTGMRSNTLVIPSLGPFFMHAFESVFARIHGHKTE